MEDVNIYPWNEVERLKDLYSYHILDTEAEKDFEDLARIAGQICNCSMSAITFIDKKRQWIKAQRNLSQYPHQRETSFCTHTILQDDVLEVSDPLKDDRFCNYQHVKEGLKIRFYAGAPIYSPTGYKLGSVCVLDNVPKKLKREQRASLKMISKQVTKLLELKLKNRLLQKQSDNTQKEYEKTYNSFFIHGALPQWIYDLSTLRFLEVNAAAEHLYGYTADEFKKMIIPDIWPHPEANNTQNIIEQINNSKDHFTFISKHMYKDGSVKNVEVMSSKIYYKDRLAGIATINDITEKVSLQKTLIDEQINSEKKVTQASIAGHEKEREILGKELHDNINQLLASTKLMLELAKTSDELRMELIAKSIDILGTAMKEIRSLSKSLVLPTLREIGLIDSIEELIETYTITNTFKVHFTHAGDIESLPPDTKLTLFRIIQEQLNNITKHALASNVWLVVKNEVDEVTLSIKDDGVGFNVSAKKNGIGLYNIRARVDSLHGKTTIQSQPGKGCHLSVTIPVK